MFRFVLMALILPLALAGCAGERVWAPDEAIEAVRYRDPGPAKITLYTMINNRTGSGAHSSFMVNASERVIFDPAGSTKLSTVPERNDVLYGITPLAADFYARSHARETYHVIIQELRVSPEVAEMAYRQALQAGPVGPALCAQATSTILSSLPGLQGLPRTYYPKQLAEAFGRVPGVQTRELYENDDPDKSKALEQWDAARYRQDLKKTQ